MRSKFAMFLFLLVANASLLAQGDGKEAINHYVGATRCKNCHQAADAGDQYGRWMQEKHPHAFEVLGTAQAKEYGKARGIADPQTDPKCLKCHVTGYEAPKEQLHRSFDPKLGVQCESCHGPGEKHMRARMTAAMKTDPAAKPAYTEVGDDEIIRAPGRDTCVKCHNEESPGYKPFCFHRFEHHIRHLNPKKPRTDEQKKELETCACDDKCVCKKDGKCDGGAGEIGATPAPAGKDKKPEDAGAKKD